MSEDNKNFTVEGVDHIGIVPNESSDFSVLLKDTLGLFSSPLEEIKDQETVVHKIGFGIKKNLTKATDLELLEPIDGKGVIQKYRKKNKSGLHHIALRVTGLKSLIAFLEKKQVKMIDSKPRIGHNNSLIAFIHPKSTSGILVELIEK